MPNKEEGIVLTTELVGIKNLKSTHNYRLGNTKGRRSAYSDLIKQYSFTKIDDVERRDKVVGKLFQLAERGDMRAIQFIIERLEGKSREFKEVTHKSEPIQIMSID